MNKLYEMYEVDDRIYKKLVELDYFFFAASCAKRCYKGVEFLTQQQGFLKDVVVFDYHKFRPKEFNTDRGEYESYYKYRKLKRITEVQCRNEDDAVLHLNTMPINTGSRVGLDITALSIPDLFRIIYVLKEIKKVEDIHIFYTEPKHYYFKDGLFSSYEFLVGERKNKPIPEYFTSGREDKEILVLFLGFDRVVSKYVHDRVMPTDVVAVNGFPSYMPKLKDISLINNYELLSTIGKEKIVSTKANNPFSTYNTLCEIKAIYKDYLLNICVLGTKPMALGACLFSIDNKDSVKVTYPYPKEYNISGLEEGASLLYYKI